jgi:hypothetical protein
VDELPDNLGYVRGLPCPWCGHLGVADEIGYVRRHPNRYGKGDCPASGLWTDDIGAVVLWT